MRIFNESLPLQNPPSMSLQIYTRLFLTSFIFLIILLGKFSNTILKLLLLIILAAYPVWIMFFSPKTRISKYKTYLIKVNEEIEIGNRENICFIRSDLPLITQNIDQCVLKQDISLFSSQTNPECSRCHLKFMFERNHPVFKLQYFFLTSPNSRLLASSPFLFQKFLLEEWIQLSSGNIEGQTFKLDGYSQRQNDLFSNADIPIDEKLVWMDTVFVIGKTNTLNFSFNHIGAYAPVASGGSGISGMSYSQDKMAPIMATTKQNANVKLAGILILTDKSLLFKRPDSIIPFNLSQITKIEFDKNKILIQLGVSPGIYEYEVKDIARWRMHYNFITKSI